MKKSFVLYTDSYSFIQKLSLEQRGKLFTDILEYANGIEITNHDPVIDIAFSMIQAQLDRDGTKWENKKNVLSQNGRLGGLAKQANARIAKQNKQNKQSLANLAVNVNVNDNVNANVSTGLKPKFANPSLEQIQSYCQERNNQVNPQRLFDYYESNGWRVGRNPMKDWRAAVRNWESKEVAPKKSKAEETAENGRKYRESIGIKEDGANIDIKGDCIDTIAL